MASRIEDYAPISDFYAYQQLSSNSDTDALALVLNVPDAWPYGVYTTCGYTTLEGGGNGYYRWCDMQLLIIDPTHQFTIQEVEGDPDYFACHELGHTTGLQHPANLYGGRVTCMNYMGHEVLHGHEIQHLNDCYPRPDPSQYDLTTVCDEYVP